jgi:glycerol uptake facilitator protein
MMSSVLAKSPYLAEFLGTMLLVILGDGVVANVLLTKSKGYNSGWIVITTGWGLGVALAIYAVGAFSGAHINPAVTLGLAAIGKFKWSLVAGYISAQVLGAMAGGAIVWLAYHPHWKETADPGTKLAVFCTSPAIERTPMNLLTEMIGTFVLVLGVLAIRSPHNLVPNSDFDKGLAPLLVGVLVWSIGLSLGGPTGYAINPARDFGPRLAHSLLPIAGKGVSNWAYAWVPILGPLIGGVLGAVCYQLLWNPG